MRLDVLLNIPLSDKNKECLYDAAKHHKFDYSEQDAKSKKRIDLHSLNLIFNSYFRQLRQMPLNNKHNIQLTKDSFFNVLDSLPAEVIKFFILKESLVYLGSALNISSKEMTPLGKRKLYSMFDEAFETNDVSKGMETLTEYYNFLKKSSLAGRPHPGYDDTVGVLPNDGSLIRDVEIGNINDFNHLNLFESNLSVNDLFDQLTKALSVRE